jgi:outer membrane lipoprotein SlyB
MKKLLIASFVLAACGAASAQNVVTAPAIKPRAVALCDSCGVVQSVHQEKRKGEGGAVGIVGGALVGGLLGNQIGGGSGKTLATVGGAVAGGYAGNEVQKHVNTRIVWITKVKMKDGSLHRYEQQARPAWAAGQVVRIHENKTLSKL